MEDIIEARVLRLIGPDGSVCAVFEARNKGASLIQVGSPASDGAITLLVEESGNCSLTVATVDGYSQFTIDARKGVNDSLESVVMVSLRNAEGKVVLDASAEQDRSSITLSNLKGQERLTLVR